MSPTLVTATLAGQSRTSSLIGALERSEGQEIIWSGPADGGLSIQIVEDRARSDATELQADHRLGRVPSTIRQKLVPLPAVRPLRRHPKKHAALTSRRLAIANRLWSIVRSKALQSGLAVDADIGVEEGIEDRTNQVVLAIHVQGNSSQALALWKSLDIDLDRWMERLSTYEQGVLMNDVGLRFSWVE